MAYRGSNTTVVWALIAANLVLFIATLFEQDLIRILGLQPASFGDRPWTLLTSMFMHANVWHILFNMVTLYFFGSYLTRLLGAKRFLIVYFAGGILGSALYLLLGSPYSTVIGASGAIFALGGALTVMRPRLRVLVFPIPAPLPLWVAVIGIFAIFSFLPSVAWQAHLGGLVFGLAAGYFFRRRERYYYS
ncbi:MAG TPA: rhomboid family intramembrane serine protease [Dehalococcoidia bacterium]|nr:rhomboid family intramembrane serine protease [Dehalococcoidia bacterium]